MPVTQVIDSVPVKTGQIELGSKRTVVVGATALFSLLIPMLMPPGISIVVTLCVGSILVAAVLSGSTEGDPTKTPPANLSIIAMLPVGFLALTFSNLIASLFASWAFSLNLLSSGGSLGVWAFNILAWSIIGLRRRGRVYLFKGDGASGVVAASFMSLGAIVVAIQPFEMWSRAVSSSTDFDRHLIFIKSLLNDGGLSYATESYPRGLHAIVGVLWSSSGGRTFVEAWQSLEAVTWMMLVFMILSMSIVFSRSLAILDIRGRWLLFAGLFIQAAAFVQSMWITSAFRMGFVTSIFAGLVMAATLTLGVQWRGQWLGSPWSLAWAAISVSLFAHSWTLFMPTASIGGIMAVLITWRIDGFSRLYRRDWLGAWVLVIAAAASSIPPLFSLVTHRGSDGEIQSDLAMAGTSGLNRPEVWWYAIGILALVSLVIYWINSAKRFAILSLSILLAGAVTIAIVASAGTTRSGGMNYYALKSLWTFSVVITPLAVVGTAWFVGKWVKSIQCKASGMGRAVSGLSFLVLVVVLSAGIAGRISGTPSALIDGLRNGFGIIPFQIPVITELESRGIGASGEVDQPIIVWGVVPNATAFALNTYNHQFADQLALESSEWVGAKGLGGNPMVRAIYGRDTETACEYLRRNPDAIRVTGPNPAAGAPWLIESGCPADVVKSDMWISVPIDDAWLAGTSLDFRPYQYPSYAEFEAEYARTHPQ